MLSEHFSEAEMACKCCGIVNVDPFLIMKMESLRKSLDRPLVITSGCRCRDHNAKIGGAKNSFHITTPKKPCQAVDFHCVTEDERYEFVAKAIGLRFSGIRIDGAFVHLDIRPGIPKMGLY